MVEREIVKDEEGYRVMEYRCEYCGTLLWRRYLHNDQEVIVGDCRHYTWEIVGNGCYPHEIDPQICEGINEIVKKSIKKIEESTSTYFLIPKDS